MLNRVFRVVISLCLLAALVFLAATVDVTVVYADDGGATAPAVTETENAASEQADEVENPAGSVEFDDADSQAVEGAISDQMQGDIPPQPDGETADVIDDGEPPEADSLPVPDDSLVPQEGESGVDPGMGAAPIEENLPPDAAPTGTLPPAETEAPQAIESALVESEPPVENANSQSLIPVAQPLVPDPYLFVGGVKHSFLPSGGDCTNDPNCTASTTPISDMLTYIQSNSHPDGGLVYFESGIFTENFAIDGFSEELTFAVEPDADVTFSGDIAIQNNSALVKLDSINLTGVVTLENNAEVNLIGTDGDNEFDLVLAGTDANTIKAEGGEGDDTLTIQGDASDESYQYNEVTVSECDQIKSEHKEPTVIRNSNQVVIFENDDIENITVDGLGGVDTLVGPDDGATFNINGTNSGNLQTDEQTVSFVGMENLQGEMDNKDTFVVLAGGTISGTVDGGSTGHDIITVDDSAYASIVFTPPWPSPSGKIDYDGHILNYSGMEPTLCSTCLGDIEFFVRPGDVDVILKRNASDELVFESYGGLLKEVVNETGILSLTIYLATNVYQTVTVERLGLFEADLSIVGNPFAVQGVTFAGNVYLQGHDLKVEANYITVNANVTLSTRHVANPETANHVTAASTENSGEILFTSGTYQEDANGEVNFLVPGTTHTYGTGITINNGAKLLAHATDPYSAGQIKVLAFLTDWSSNLPIDAIPFTGEFVGVSIDGALIKGGNIEISAKKYSSVFSPFRLIGVRFKTTDIDISDSTIEGDKISIAAESKDISTLDLIPDQVDNFWFDIFWKQFNSVLVSTLTSFIFDGLLPPAPVTVMIRGAKAYVDLNNSTINSAGDVKIDAVAVVDSSVASLASKDATMWTSKLKKVAAIEKFINMLAFSYSHADVDARVNLLGTTAITAAGSVTLKSNTTVTASGAARNSSNASSESPVDPYAVALSVGIAVSNTTSHAIVGKDASINAGKNVNVHALAKVTNSAKSETVIYEDGLGGLGIALGFDFADVLAEVNGTITAVGSDVDTAINLTDLGIEFTKPAGIDYANDVLRIPGHGLNTDDHVVYEVERKDGEDEPLVEIGGLVPGETYRVIKVDDDNLQLAMADALNLDASEVNVGSTHTFSRRESLTFDPGSAVNTADDKFEITGHGFSN